jgi:tRNA U54 and U55 pseudouridine synthase Pus10
VGVDAEILSTDREIIILNNAPVFADEHTEEINEQKEIEQKKAEEQETAQTVATLKADMLTAIALNDTEWLEDLRAEYAELTGE